MPPSRCSLKRARAERDAAAAQAAALAQRLAQAERRGERIIPLKDGRRTWRVAEGDLVLVRAQDDYCEAWLSDGRVLLVTVGLSRLIEQLPPSFLRVHKSWAVNRSHILSSSARPGGGRQLDVSNGLTVPIGRAYAEAIA